jgi:putative endonuclease
MNTYPQKDEQIELRVLNWLADKGFQLVKRNWKYCHDSVDIIATRLGELHFIGITTRHLPGQAMIDGQSITRRRILSFLQASQQYLKRNPQWKNVSIDVLTVTLMDDKPVSCCISRNLRV